MCPESFLFYKPLFFIIIHTKLEVAFANLQHIMVLSYVFPTANKASKLLLTPQ